MGNTLPQRVTENAPGDFYVLRDTCLQCCLPHGEAPELLNDPGVAFRECYFRRQPRDEGEVERACLAMRSSCVGALRYAGSDPKILARLRELGVEHQCDQVSEIEGVPRAGERRAKRSWWRRWFGGEEG